MPKYDEEKKKLCVAAVKAINTGSFVKHNGAELKNLTDVKKAYGPNPKAIGRYCKAAGVPLPKKKVAEPKAAKTPAPGKK